jgi:hypothetical protein
MTPTQKGNLGEDFVFRLLKDPSFNVDHVATRFENLFIAFLPFINTKY